MSKMMMFGEIFESESQAIFGEAHEGVVEGDVDIHVFPNVTIVSGRRRGTVDNVLNFVILLTSLGWI